MGSRRRFLALVVACLVVVPIGHAPASAADRDKAERPAGASGAPPRQRTGAAPGGGDHYTTSAATKARSAVPVRRPARPDGAVPDVRTVARPARSAPARERLIRPAVQQIRPAGRGFDARTSVLVDTPDAGTRVFRNADGTFTAQLSASQINSSDDTFVMSGHGDESDSPDLQVGSEDGGRHIGRAYLKFSGLDTTLKNKYVNGAALTLFNTWSSSCSPTPVTVFQVSESWSGGSLRWPGASVNRAYETRSFAHVGGSSSCAPAWEPLAINADDATKWTHGSAFHGLSVRAPNEKASSQFKRFAAAGSANKPHLDITYSAEGAGYEADEVLLPTNTTAGQLTATVQNQGGSTWAAGGGFKLGVVVKRGSTVVATSAKVAPTAAIAPMASGTIKVPIPAVAPGEYTLEIQMYNAAGKDFRTEYGVPAGTMPIKVNNVLPAVNYEQPGSGAEVESITPTLYAEAVDPDNWPANANFKYDFKICTGTPELPTNCKVSGWTGRTWTPPALAWSTTYLWWIRAHDTIGAGPFTGPLTLTTRVPQPEITSNLAGNPTTVNAPGVDPGIGNYSTVVTDASVPTVGPDLTITRTYNSLDPRRDNAFGAGWASRLDTSLAEDPVAPGAAQASVVVTLPTGRQVRFGRNVDGSYAPPQGQALTLVRNATTATWTLRDATGMRWVFDALGRLSQLIDGDGLTETLRHNTEDRVVEIVNDTSKRRLNLTWLGGHVTEVTANGGPAWKYQYDGNRLTSVCGPDPAPNCTTYEYGTGSHYRSAVLDDGPRGYWRFGETSGAAAASTTARIPGADAGTYTGVVLGADGAIGGTQNRAAVFDGASSRVQLPAKLASQSMSASVELWFRTTGSGVLLSYQNGQPFPATASSWTPLMYVGVDGLMYGGFAVPKPEGPRQAISDAQVNDGDWHHAVLSASINKQTLYIDGQAQQIVASGPVEHRDQIQLTAGAGNGKDWPSTNGEGFYFDGAMDELAVYGHPLGPLAVANHYRAATATDVLTRVVMPESTRQFAALTYDDDADRVRTLRDSWGRDWQLDSSRRNGATSTIALHGPYPDWVYTVDADHGGRLTAVAHNGATTRYAYNTAGFLAKVTDANDHSVAYTTDPRGNVLSETTCRAANSCNTSYSTYFLNAQDTLDPRNDRVLSRSDARSSGPADVTYRTGFEYDATGALVRVTYPKPAGATAAPVETWTYAKGTESAEGGGTVPAGLLVEHLGRRNQSTKFQYRSTGDLSQTTSPLDLRTRYVYDDMGRVKEVSTGNGGGATFATTGYTYTPSSAVRTITEPAVVNPISGVRHQKVTTYAYDGDGNTVSVTEADTTPVADGGDAARVTTYQYDASDRPTLTTLPDKTTTRVSYSADGLRVSTLDHGGTTWTDVYDDERRLLTRIAEGKGVDPQNASATVLTLEWRGYDPAGRLATYTDAMGRATRYTYYDDGLPASSIREGYHDPAGTVRDVALEQRSYDPAGNPTSVTELGITTASTYDPAGQITREIVDPAGLKRTTDYVRDADGNATQVKRTGAAQPDRVETTGYGYGPDNQVTAIEQFPAAGATLSTAVSYDERGLPLAVRNPRLLTTNHTFDAAGRISTTTEPAVDTWTAGQVTRNVRPVSAVGYNTFGETSHFRDPNGKVTTAHYDERGRVDKLTKPAYAPPAGVTITPFSTFEYDYAGRLKKSTDPLQRSTEFTFDPHGNVLTLTAPKVDDQPSTTTMRYTRERELLSRTSPGGAQTQNTYDELGRVVTSTVAERVPGPTSYFITGYEYDDGGRLTKVVSPENHVIRIEPNAAGETRRITDPTQRATTIDYDIAGRELSSTDATGLTTGTTYDLAGRVVGGVQRRGESVLRTTTAELDPNGNTKVLVSGEGRRTTFDYDALDREVGQTAQPVAGRDIRVENGYDAAGNRTRYVDGNRHATDYTYNAWGLPESTVEPATATTADPAARTWTNLYDAAAQVVGVRVPGGVTRTQTYDAQGRLTRETGAGAEGATGARTLGYDADGRTVRVGGAAGDTTYAYDDRGNLVGSQGAGGDATLTWSGDGNNTTRTDRAGTAVFTYDDAGRPTSFSDPVTQRVVDYGYDTGGRLGTVIDRASSRTVKRVIRYDDLNRVAADQLEQTVTAGVPPRVLLGDSYGYDRDDNVTSKTVAQPSGSTANTYAYDGVSRLDSWTTAGRTTDYEFDDAGNRTRAGSATAVYNEQNQLTDDGARTYGYTPRGTLRQVTPKDGSAGRTLAFDAFERMTADGATTYGYDALDRVATRDGQDGFEYAGQTNNLVADGARVLSRDAQGQPFADRAESASTGRMLYADGHGDVTGRYLSASAVDLRSYDPFGTVTGATGETPAVGYQGAWTEPSSGAVNMASRWYEPSTGGFRSRDTWTLPPDPGGLGNRYSYGTGDPVGETDASGHCPLCVIGVEVGVEIVVEWLWPGNEGAPACEMAKPPNCHWKGNSPQGFDQQSRYIGYTTGFGTRGSGSGNGKGNGNGRGGPRFVPFIPPPPPPWIPPLFIPVKPPPPAKTVKPRVPRVRVDKPDTRWIDPGPAITALAGAITAGQLMQTATEIVGLWVLEIGRSFLNDRLHIWDGQNDPDAGNYNDDRKRCFDGTWTAAQPINYFERDANRRATGADACYNGYIPTGGTEATYTPRGYQEGVGLARGHLIARSLGGSGQDPRNIVPIYQNKVNSSAMYHGVEKIVEAWVRGGGTVYYRVEPVYKGNDPVPEYLRLVVATEIGTLVIKIDNRK